VLNGSRNLILYYLVKARRYAVWALLIFLLWRCVPVVYQMAVFPFDLDLFALDAANARAHADRVRRAVAEEAETRGLLVAPDDIRVESDLDQKTVTIDVTYHAPIDLFLKQFILGFHAHARQHATPRPNQEREEVP
jgi:hypothetical protein